MAARKQGRRRRPSSDERRGGAGGAQPPASNGTRGSYDHFGKTLWPSDMRRRGIVPGQHAPDAEPPPNDPDEDRRGNLIDEARPSRPAPRGTSASRREKGQGQGEASPGKGRRRRRGRSRRGRGEREKAAPAARSASHERPGPPLPEPSYPEIDPEERPTRAPVEVVRRFLELVQASREQAHAYHRKVAACLGTERLREEVDRWARHWTDKGRRETVLGRALIEDGRAEVRTTGEGFGQNRYLLVQGDDDAWRIETIEVACAECEESGRCALCEGEGCEACSDGACPRCQGAGWVPYRK